MHVLCSYLKGCQLRIFNNVGKYYRKWNEKSKIWNWVCVCTRVHVCWRKCTKLLKVVGEIMHAISFFFYIHFPNFLQWWTYVAFLIRSSVVFKMKCSRNRNNFLIFFFSPVLPFFHDWLLWSINSQMLLFLKEFCKPLFMSHTDMQMCKTNLLTLESFLQFY